MCRRQRVGREREERREEKCVYTDGRAPGEAWGRRGEEVRRLRVCSSNFLLRERKKPRIRFQASRAAASSRKPGEDGNQRGSGAINFQQGSKREKRTEAGIAGEAEREKERREWSGAPRATASLPLRELVRERSSWRRFLRGETSGGFFCLFFSTSAFFCFQSSERWEDFIDSGTIVPSSGRNILKMRQKSDPGSPGPGTPGPRDPGPRDPVHAAVGEL